MDTLDLLNARNLGVSSDCQSDILWDHKSRKKVGKFKRNCLRDGGFHKNETLYFLKRKRERVGSFYKQNIFLEIVGGFYKNKTEYLIKEIISS